MQNRWIWVENREWNLRNSRRQENWQFAYIKEGNSKWSHWKGRKPCSKWYFMTLKKWKLVKIPKKWTFSPLFVVQYLKLMMTIWSMWKFKTISAESYLFSKKKGQFFRVYDDNNDFFQKKNLWHLHFCDQFIIFSFLIYHSLSLNLLSFVFGANTIFFFTLFLLFHWIIQMMIIFYFLKFFSCLWVFSPSSLSQFTIQKKNTHK